MIFIEREWYKILIKDRFIFKEFYQGGAIDTSFN